MIHQINGFDRDILVVLAAYDECPGIDVVRELESHYGVEVNRSRAYQALERLERLGLVSKETSTTDGRTNAYAITPHGERVMRAHFSWAGDMLTSCTTGATLKN